jgi:hypothetical protein
VRGGGRSGRRRGRGGVHHGREARRGEELRGRGASRRGDGGRHEGGPGASDGSSDASLFSGPDASSSLPPATPLCLAVTAASDTELEVSWTQPLASPETTKWSITRDGSSVGTATTPVFHDTGLAAGSTHSYTVAAKGPGGTSAVSSSASGMTLTATSTTPLTACGNLSTAGAHYLLANDVSSPGTCFTVSAPGVTLDLGGNTVTYDDAPPIVVANGDLESGSGTTPASWDLSKSPNASWITGTFTSPVEVHSGTHSIEVTLPAPDQSLASTVPLSGLAPNTWYTLAFTSYCNCASTTSYVEFQGTSIQATNVGTSNRGFQYSSVMFQTAATVPSYTIVVGISGATGEAAGGQVFVDDISVQRLHPQGVVLGAESWETPTEHPYADLTAPDFGDATGSLLIHGSIKEGQGSGEGAHGVTLGADSKNVVVSGISVDVHGENAKNIDVPNGASGNVLVGNDLTSEVTTITNRDQFDGADIGVGYTSTATLVYRNTLLGGAQNGVQIGAASVGSVDLCGNDIALTTYYANDFALQLYGDLGTKAHENVIDCGSGPTAA